MATRVTCSSCGTKLAVAEGASKAKCPQCGTVVKVPGSAPKKKEPADEAPAPKPEKKFLDPFLDAGPLGDPLLDDSYAGVDEKRQALREKKKRGSGKYKTRFALRCPRCRRAFDEPFDGPPEQLARMKIWWWFSDGEFSHCPSCGNHFDLKSFAKPIVGLGIAGLLGYASFYLLRYIPGMLPTLNTNTPDLGGAEVAITPLIVSAQNGDQVIPVVFAWALIAACVIGTIVALGASIWRLTIAIIQRS